MPPKHPKFAKYTHYKYFKVYVTHLKTLHIFVSRRLEAQTNFYEKRPFDVCLGAISRNIFKDYISM